MPTPPRCKGRVGRASEKANAPTRAVLYPVTSLTQHLFAKFLWQHVYIIQVSVIFSLDILDHKVVYWPFNG